MTQPLSSTSSDGPYAAWHVPSFRRYLPANFLMVLGVQMETAAVAWQVYEHTHGLLNLGWIGLLEFAPVALLTLPAGHAADRFDRRYVVLASVVLMGLGSVGLAVISWLSADGSRLSHASELRWVYACVLLTGIARAFQQPAKASLLPQLVPREIFSNAVSWNMTGFQLASVLGPAAAGYGIWLFGGPTPLYLLVAAASAVFALVLATLKLLPSERVPLTGLDRRSMWAGADFVWRRPVILGAISLDMFAVLLGGATMLLPVYAEDILHADAAGYGRLRAAPAVGALVTSFLLAHLPSIPRAGRTLLWSVAGFGVATIVFGLSRNIWLSLGMLFLTGAFDMVSVVIRHTLVQTLTPDEMRGRVSAVNSIFIGASNELGGFESSLVAHLCSSPDDPARGPTLSVVSGGLGTLIVVALVSTLIPPLRRYGSLRDSRPTPP